MSEKELDLQEIGLLRRRVINVVGHELRTPITTLRGLAELVATADLETIRSELAPALIRNAERSEDLLDDLLAASGVSTAAPVVERETVPVSTVVNEAVDQTEGIDVGPIPPVTVAAHRRRLTRAVRHLVDNAIGYSDDATATIEASTTGESVTIRVRSRTSGPTPDPDLSFELFFRGEQAVTTAPGLGVGLPVARATARDEGGDVTMTIDGDEVCVEMQLPIGVDA